MNKLCDVCGTRFYGTCIDETCKEKEWYEKGYADAIDEIKEIMKKYVTFENVDLFVGSLLELKENKE